MKYGSVVVDDVGDSRWLRPRWHARQVVVALMASEILMTMAATSGVDVVRVGCC